MDKKIVFICAPFAGDTLGNIEKTKLYCRFAMSEGMIPFSSALLFPQFLDDGDPDERALGLSFSVALLRKCDAIWVFGETVSSGMEVEIKEAQRLKMDIYCFSENCKFKIGYGRGKRNVNEH